MDRLTICDQREPVVIVGSQTTLEITGPADYIQSVTRIIYEGIDLWDEAELTG
jgi:hypothetical protein